jgi:hypothetical protein
MRCHGSPPKDEAFAAGFHKTVCSYTDQTSSSFAMVSLLIGSQKLLIANKSAKALSVGHFSFQ